MLRQSKNPFLVFPAAVAALLLGMSAVIGLEWLLRTKLGVEISPAIRNVLAAAFGLHLFSRVAGDYLVEQFEIEKKKRNGQR